MTGEREHAFQGTIRSSRILSLPLRIGCLMLGLHLVFPGFAPAQGTPQNPFARPEGPGGVEEGGVLSNFALLLFPKVFADSDILREYVRTPEFAALRRRSGDLVAVDSLFVRAQSLCWGNGAEALLIAFAATLDHRRFGVKTPIPGVILWFPLTSESEEDFDARVRALPVQLYPDTPESPAGDRDKLQHFFGSAALTYICESRDPAMRVGDFIEWGEDRFVVDGMLDERDIRANWQGQQFGLRLLADHSAAPSPFFRTVIARGSDVPAPHDSAGTVTSRYREGP
jgi:hypothetical protein